MSAVSIQDLNNARLDVDHIAAVVTSGEATAADRLGGVKLTLSGALARLGYDSPAVAYSAGLSMTHGLQSVEYNGVVYAPLVGQMPFTTSGTFESSKFRVIQGLTSDDLADPNASASIGHIELETGAVARSIGEKLGDVVSDADYATLQQAIDAAVLGKRHLEISGQWPALTTSLDVPSNLSIFIRAGALVSTAVQNLTLFDINGKANVHIYGFGKLSQTGTPGTTYRGCAGIKIRGASSNCTVSGWLEFEGFSAFGVHITDTANNCKVTGGYFHDWRATAGVYVGDSAGVMIDNNAESNVCDGARCVATGYFGAAVQDVGGVGTYAPKHNKIRNCFVRDTIAYGAMLYLGAAGNSCNEITGCDIAGVTGTAPGGFFGMGIYCVGPGLGGCKITGNTVKNCCISQTATTNGYGAITVGGAVAGYARPIVSDNTIADMSQGCGIDLVSNAGGVVVGPNTVRIPAGNNGSGLGGAALVGHGLRILDCNNVTLSPGDYVVSATGGVGQGNAVLVQSTGGAYAGLILNFGSCLTEASAVVAIAGGGGTLAGSIIGGYLSSLSDLANGGQFVKWNGPIGGLHINVGSTGSATQALVLNSCNTNVSGCEANSTGAYALSVGGSSTGFWDRGNQRTGLIENSASGFRVETRSSGIPSAGIFQIGDLAINSAASAPGHVPAWARKTAGSGHVLDTDWVPFAALP